MTVQNSMEYVYFCVVLDHHALREHRLVTELCKFNFNMNHIQYVSFY